MKHYVLPYFPQTLTDSLQRYLVKYGDNQENLKDGFGFNLLLDHDAERNLPTDRTSNTFGFNKHHEINRNVILDRNSSNPLQIVRPWDLLMLMGHGVTVSDPHSVGNEAAKYFGSDPISTVQQTVNRLTPDEFNTQGHRQLHGKNMFLMRGQGYLYATFNDVAEYLDARLNRDHVLIKLVMCLGGGAYGERMPDNNFAKSLAKSLAGKGFQYAVVGGYKGVLEIGVGGSVISTTRNTVRDILAKLQEVAQQHFKANLQVTQRSERGNVARFSSPVKLKFGIDNYKIVKVFAGARSGDQLRDNNLVEPHEQLLEGTVESLTPQGVTIATSLGAQTRAFATAVKFFDLTTTPARNLVKNPNSRSQTSEARSNIVWFHGANGDLLSDGAIKLLKSLFRAFSTVYAVREESEKKTAMTRLVENAKSAIIRNRDVIGAPGEKLIVSVLKMLFAKCNFTTRTAPKVEEPKPTEVVPKPTTPTQPQKPSSVRKAPVTQQNTTTSTPTTQGRGKLVLKNGKWVRI